MARKVSADLTKEERKALKRSDQFVSAGQSALESLQKHWKPVAAALGILLLVTAGVILLAHQKKAQSQKAAGALFLAEQAFEEAKKGVRFPGEVEKKEPPNPLAKLNQKEKNKKEEPKVEKSPFQGVDKSLGPAVGQLKSVSEKFSGTKAAFQASMTLGNIYFEHQEYDASLKHFQEARGHAKDDLMKASADLARGYVSEALGKFEQAIEAFRSVSESSKSKVLKGDALLGLARSYALSKQQGKAKGIYDQIITELPETPFAEKAKGLKAKY